jgi:DNA-binding XRE family transcriptional regulator
MGYILQEMSFHEPRFAVSCTGVKEKIIHFGEFIRWHRVQAGKTTEALGREIGLTARRLIAIEAMAKPDVQHTTMASLARVFKIDPEQFDTVWQTTPVPVTRRKPGPSTDEARRFAAACSAAGVTQVDGTRRLRSWIIEQPPSVQREALAFVGGRHAVDESFTHVVDHLQDPAEAARERVGKMAAAQSGTGATQPGSAATGENTHR